MSSPNRCTTTRAIVYSRYFLLHVTVKYSEQFSRRSCATSGVPMPSFHCLKLNNLQPLSLEPEFYAVALRPWPQDRLVSVGSDTFCSFAQIGKTARGLLSFGFGAFASCLFIARKPTESIGRSASCTSVASASESAAFNPQEPKPSEP